MPVAVGSKCKEAGHIRILYNEVLREGVADEVVAATAIENAAILVAHDNDMKRLARRYGEAAHNTRFGRLHLIRLCCPEPQAASRAEQAMSLIQHEWTFASQKAARRLWVDVGPHFIRTHR